MQSKFSLLPIGQHFTYQGSRYVKVSPLIARLSEGSSQRMIPRSALVEVAQSDAAAAPPQLSTAPLPAERVIAAFDASHAWLLAQLPEPSAGLSALLEAQRQRFLDALARDDERH